jgi:hypothetical protein
MILTSDQLGNHICFFKNNFNLKCCVLKNDKNLKIIFEKNFISNSPFFFLYYVTNFYKRKKENCSFFQQFFIFLLICKLKEIKMINNRKKKYFILQLKEKINSLSIFNDSILVCSNWLIYFFDIQSAELLKIISLTQLNLEKKIKKIQFSENGDNLILIGKNLYIYNLKVGVIIKKIKKNYFFFSIIGQLNKNCLFLGFKNNFNLWEINKNFLKNFQYAFDFSKNLLKKNFIVRTKNLIFILMINKLKLKIIFLKTFDANSLKVFTSKIIFLKKKICSFDFLLKDSCWIFFFGCKNKIFPFKVKLNNKKNKNFLFKKTKDKFKKKLIKDYIFNSKNFLKKKEKKRFVIKQIKFIVNQHKYYWNVQNNVQYYFLIKFVKKFKIGKVIIGQLNFFQSLNILKISTFIKDKWIEPFSNFILKKIFTEKNFFFSILKWFKEILLHRFLYVSKNKFLKIFLKKYSLLFKNLTFQNFYFESSFFLCKLILQIMNFKKKTKK